MTAFCNTVLLACQDSTNTHYSKAADLRSRSIITSFTQCKDGKFNSVGLLEKKLEAASGFEPENGGFADLCLTTWLCRPLKKWSGKRDLNPRLQPWQGCTLPLSYSRSVKNS